MKCLYLCGLLMMSAIIVCKHLASMGVYRVVVDIRKYQGLRYLQEYTLAANSIYRQKQLAVIRLP